MWRCSCPVHGSIHNPFEGLISPFKWVLVLIIGLTSPNFDPKHSEIVKDLVRVVARGTVTNHSVRGSPCGNKALQSLKKWSRWSNMLRVNQMGFSANEDV